MMSEQQQGSSAATTSADYSVESAEGAGVAEGASAEAASFVYSHKVGSFLVLHFSWSRVN